MAALAFRPPRSTFPCQSPAKLVRELLVVHDTRHTHTGSTHASAKKLLTHAFDSHVPPRFPAVSQRRCVPTPSLLYVLNRL